MRDIVRPVEIDGWYVDETSSVFVAMSYDDITPDDMLRAADNAMYRAKTNGKNGFSLTTRL